MSATRLGQVSGRSDPDGLYHYQDTSQWGIEGVDLGASALHHDRTYIFFGDVPRAGREGGPVHDADAIGVIDDVAVPVGAHIATAKQGPDQTDAFFIGVDGALYVSWVIGGDHWFHPLQISRPGLAPPGGAIAVAHQSESQLDVFFMGVNGSLYVTWVVDDGVWQGPLQISPSGVGEPGGELVAIKQRNNQLDVLFIGRDRRLNVAWVLGNGEWHAPLAVGDPSAPYPHPGSGVAACRQGEDQLDAFFIGEDGGFYVAWSTEGGNWQGPQRVSPPGVQASVSGGNLTAFNQSAGQVTVLFVDAVGRLASMFVIGGGVWQGPAPAVPTAPMSTPGTHVAVERQGDNQWDAFVVSAAGEIDVYWVGANAWQGPVQIGPPGGADDRGALSAVWQLPDQITVISGGPAGELNVNWVRGLGGWQGPVRINPEMTCVRFVTSGRYFRPLTIQGTETNLGQLWQLGTGETPTGAFSYGDRVYVFVVAGGKKSVSYLISSDWPDGPDPFKFHFAFSRGPEVGRFLQVAPVVVRTAEVRGVPSEAAEGIILFGHGSPSPGIQRAGCLGKTSPAAINLAFMPLLPGVGPVKERTLYYANAGWTADESAATSLVPTCYYWTSISAGRIPGIGKWILLYQLSAPAKLPGDPEPPQEAHELPIVARIADNPWDIASAPEIVVFDPQLDGAWDRYMFKPGTSSSSRDRPHIDHPAFAYGAFLLHKYTRWDPELNQATIFFLMSTGRPYQVQLLRASLPL